MKLVALLITVFLTACAQLGMAPADTFNKRLAVGYTTVQTVAEGAKVLLDAKKISPADRDHVVTSAKLALQGVDMAKSIHDSACPAGSPSTCSAPDANAKLQATLAVLTALQSYLATQGAKP